MRKWVYLGMWALVCAGPALGQSTPVADRADGAQDAPVWLYGVRPGDTLIGLGQRYLAQPARWDTVQRLNHVADPKRIPSGTVLRIPADLLRVAPGQATVRAVHGTVRWRLPGAAWASVVIGQALGVGAELQTGAEASAALELANGTRLHVHAGSTLALDTVSLYAGGLMADTRVRLQQGQAEFMDNPGGRAQQHLRVLTPSAQAVVRGTVFRVGVQPGVTREETVTGAVAVAAAGQTVVVTQSLGTLARTGQAPLPPRPLLAAPDLSHLARRQEQLPLRFAFATQQEAHAWWGQIAPDDSFDTILMEKTSATPVLTFADLPNGNYVLRVRALDEAGLQGLEARHAFTVQARPFAPALQAPGHAATVRQARAALIWTAAVDAQRYRLQVSRDAAFTSPLFDHIVPAATWTPSADLPQGPLHWRVASINAAGEQGPWSGTAHFVYKPAPGLPDLGQAALRYETDAMWLELPPPPAGQRYQVSVSDTAQTADTVPQHTSTDGKLRLPRPSGGEHLLGVRLVDLDDGTIGPAMLQKITVPTNVSPLWWLLLPLLAL